MKVSLHQFLPVNILAELFTLLEARGKSRLVGGCVREIILGHAPKDVDIATQVLPEDVMYLLAKSGYHCIPTGIRYGTITAVKDKHKFEITTLRSDIRTYGRHAEVDFTTDWKLDAGRRDFTFNALYMDLSGNVEDFFGGIADLNAHLLRFIGEPRARIREDYLRILRYFRFYSYYNGRNIDQASLDACAELAPGLENLSGERIRIEMLKILASPYANQSLLLMQEYGVLKEIIPHRHEIDFTMLYFCANPLVNLAAILKVSALDKYEIEACMNRLKLFNSEKSMIASLLWKIEIKAHARELEHKAVIYSFGIGAYKSYINFLQVLYPKAGVYEIKTPDIPEFPVVGADLLKLGLAGKEIGSKIKQLEKLWIESDFKLTKIELLKKL